MPLMNLQALPDEFKQLPLMAVRGCLHGRLWKETQGLQYTFFTVDFVFPNTHHATIPRRVFSFKVGHFHVRTIVTVFLMTRQRFLKTLVWSLNCIGKTKSIATASFPKFKNTCFPLFAFFLPSHNLQLFLQFFCVHTSLHCPVT